MKVELQQDEFGDLHSTNIDILDIDIFRPNTPTSSAGMMLETQAELDEGFKFLKIYDTKVFGFNSFSDDVKLDLSNSDYLKELKSLSAEFKGKNCSLYLLVKDETLPNITEFVCKSDNFIDFNEYLSLIKLKKLTVQYHKKSSGWLEHEGIIDLTVHKYKADDLTGLSKMQSLKRLTLVQGSIKSLNGIENLKNLETLHINSVRNLTDLTALLKSTSIENLIFEAYSKVTDWDFLSEMKQLRQLNLKETKSIQFTKELPNLIFCYAEKIHDKNREPETIIEQRYEALNLPEGTPLPGFKQLVNVFEDD